jgi:hypothetical protein
MPMHQPQQLPCSACGAWATTKSHVSAAHTQPPGPGQPVSMYIIVRGPQKGGAYKGYYASGTWKAAAARFKAWGMQDEAPAEAALFRCLQCMGITECCFCSTHTTSCSLNLEGQALTVGPFAAQPQSSRVLPPQGAAIAGHHTQCHR